MRRSTLTIPYPMRKERLLKVSFGCLVSMENRVEFDVEKIGNAAIIAFKATSISSYEGVIAASEQIKNFIEENNPKVVIFDFEQVKFFCSQVLGLLLEIRARQKDIGGDIIISAIDPNLHRVFRITNLDKIFTFSPDKQAAMREVQNEQ